MGVVGYDSNQEAAVDLSTKTPVEIDEQLFPLYAQRWQQVDRLVAQERHIADHESGKYGWQPPIYIEKAKAELPEIQAKIDDLNVEITPLADEYDRRPWNRFVVVPGGHIHKIWCETLRPTTQRFWLTEASGISFDEVVTKYSYTACTKCFPDAPVAPEPKADPTICPGSGQYADDVDWRMYIKTGTCPVCHRSRGVSSHGKIRKHKREGA
jgi:hypothetical protein